MQFNQATDYAFRVILFLAGQSPDEVVKGQTIAERQKIPFGFLQKIMRALSKSHLVKSYRGVEGGFSLARPPAAITLLDVVEAMEGPIEMQRCLNDPESCGRSCAHRCPVHASLAAIQADFIAALRQVNFADLAEQNKQEGREGEV